MQSTEFIEALYGPDFPGRIVLFRIPTNRSQWIDHENLDAVSRVVGEARKNSEHLYFGVGLQAKPSAKGRGEAEGVIAVPCLWADLDLAGKPDATKNYPDEMQARIALEKMPFAPSFTILTGGGWHCYWLFQEPFECRDPGARARVARLSMAWQYRLDDILKRTSETCIDHTHDLARVLRLPGSWNPKHDCEVVLSPDSEQNPENWARYDIDTLESMMPEARDMSPMRGPARTHVCGPLALNSEMRPPTDRFDALMANSPEFAATWNHRRQLPSCSEYELSLANQAAGAGWTDQEIAELLIAHRMKYEPARISKLTGRGDYMTRTIAMARDASHEQDAVDQLEGLIERPDRQAVTTERNPANGTNVVEDRPAEASGNSVRDAILADISSLINVRISGFTQIGRHEPAYCVTLADGRRILLGQFDLMSEAKRWFTRRLQEESGEIVKKVDNRTWDTIVRALVKVVEVEEAEDLRIESSVMGLVSRYLSNRLFVEDEWQTAAQLGEPFTRGGRLYVTMNKVIDYVRRYAPTDKFTKGSIAWALDTIGFSRETIHYRKEDGRRSTASYMSIDMSAWSGATGQVDNDPL